MVVQGLLILGFRILAWQVFVDAYTRDWTFELDESAVMDVCTEGGPIGR